jgi:hypothetical protein
MKKSSLISTNIYLQDQTTRDKLLRQTVISSSAIEGAGTAAARALTGKERKPESAHLFSVAVKSV